MDDIAKFNDRLFKDLQDTLWIHVGKIKLGNKTNSELRSAIDSAVEERMTELSREGQISFSPEFVKATCDYVFDRVHNEGINSRLPVYKKSYLYQCSLTFIVTSLMLWGIWWNVSSSTVFVGLPVCLGFGGLMFYLLIYLVPRFRGNMKSKRLSRKGGEYK